MSMLTLVVKFLGSLFKSQRQLVLENLALRQQVTMLRRSVKRPRATTADKLFWIFFSRYVDSWRQVLHGLHRENRPAQGHPPAQTHPQPATLEQLVCLSQSRRDI